MKTNELIEKKVQLETMEREAKKLREEIYKSCSCPKEHLIHTEEYNIGSLDQKSSTTYFELCTICGRKHDEKVVTFNYGGK